VEDGSVERLRVPEVARALGELLAVVRGEDEEGVVEQALPGAGGEEAADEMVDARDLPS
jgi:hypothetical protein